MDVTTGKRGCSAALSQSDFSPIRHQMRSIGGFPCTKLGYATLRIVCRVPYAGEAVSAPARRVRPGPGDLVLDEELPDRDRARGSRRCLRPGRSGGPARRSAGSDPAATNALSARGFSVARAASVGERGPLAVREENSERALGKWGFRFAVRVSRRGMVMIMAMWIMLSWCWGRGFVVAGAAAVFADPAECSFDGPSAGQEDESGGRVGGDVPFASSGFLARVAARAGGGPVAQGVVDSAPGAGADPAAEHAVQHDPAREATVPAVPIAHRSSTRTGTRDTAARHDEQEQAGDNHTRASGRRTGVDNHRATRPRRPRIRDQPTPCQNAL
ncbi:hypothetical protein SAMN05421854_10730 [Amycolatopsis rubida]|uniref:Uncharacterized protein n=1 Tax=Amycolatopsis rubida TaxID=112413 RepID=A0A1I5TA46_9PSEU|nr:hypothetical protein SAMN05421854_10730 [Amycolatopsis rubida]